MPGWEWAWRIGWLLLTYLFLAWVIRQADRWTRSEGNHWVREYGSFAPAAAPVAATEREKGVAAAPSAMHVGLAFTVEEGNVLVHDTQMDAGRTIGQGQPFTCDPAAGSRWHWGRAQENDVVFLDPYVSAWHATLYVQDGHLHIEDRGSRNGTWVNGRALKSAESLSPGDVIRLGNTRIRWAGWSTY